MIRSAIHRLSPNGVHEKIGYVTFKDTAQGLFIEPEIEGLSVGEHGFHVHAIGDIEPKNGKAGGSAGTHYDPENTGRHCGPYENGHKGDLPVLVVDNDGVARTPMIAPRLKLNEIVGRAIIVHSGGDNYRDKPLKNGGGKSRIAGGIITNDCPYCKAKTMKNIALLTLIGYGLYRVGR